MTNPQFQRSRLAALFLALFTLAIPSLAEDESCDGNTYETAVCLLRVLKKVDTELNTIYQKSLKAAKDPYTPAGVANLVEKLDTAMAISAQVTTEPESKNSKCGK